MRKLFLLATVFITSFAFAQEFVLTPDGYKDKSSDKNFYVFEVAGKSQSELFTKAKVFITATYKGLKNDGYNEVAPEQMVMDVNGNKEFMALINLSGANVWKVNNRYEINFKDGRVMIKPTFSYLDNAVDIGTKADISTLFKKNGEARRPKAVEQIQIETNEFVSGLENALKSTASDDW